MTAAAFAALVGAGAVPLGALVVPRLADWAPGTPTPLRCRAWRVGQCGATVAAAVALAGAYALVQRDFRQAT